MGSEKWNLGNSPEVAVICLNTVRESGSYKSSGLSWNGLADSTEMSALKSRALQSCAGGKRRQRWFWKWARKKAKNGFPRRNNEGW